MIVASLLVALSSAPTTLPCSVLALPLRPAAASPQADDVADRIKAADGDIEVLLEMAAAYKKAKDRASAKVVFEHVITLDTDNKIARKGLRHQRYADQWFESYVELSKFKRDEASKMKEKGLAKWKDEWVPEADIPFLNMNWTKADDGTWSNPADVARANQIAAWTAEGRQFRADDNSWIASGDLQKWTDGLFLCGDDWLDLEKANEYHAKLESAWQLSGEHFIVMTTRDWQTGNWSRWYADTTYPELVRLFGVEPEGKQVVAVLRHLREYNETASSSPILRESEGFSSIHGAYFADSVLDPSTEIPQYRGCGVAYWDTNNEAIGAWGPYWIRWAAAQSYIDAIDRSWNTIGELFADGGDGGGGSFATDFWSEKSIPRWLRYGGASYVERFMRDANVKEGGDPWGIRDFALGEVKKAGGLRDMKDLFAFGITLEDTDGSARLYQEAGVVVAYLLDGAEGDKKLAGLHEDFKKALAAGDGEKARAAAKALEAELGKRKKKIEAFAGF